MIPAQRCRAQCHPQLCKLHSFGPSKPQPGGMPASWFVQLALCQRGISWGRGALGFLWVLLKLSWDYKLLQNLKSRWLQGPVALIVSVWCWTTLTRDAFLSKQWGVWAALSGVPARLPMTVLQTKLAGKRLQRAAGVNILPYATVGVSTQLMYLSNIHQKGILNTVAAHLEALQAVEHHKPTSITGRLVVCWANKIFIKTKPRSEHEGEGKH